MKYSDNLTLKSGFSTSTSGQILWNHECPVVGSFMEYIFIYIHICIHFLYVLKNENVLRYLNLYK